MVRFLRAVAGLALGLAVFADLLVAANSRRVWRWDVDYENQPSHHRVRLLGKRTYPRDLGLIGVGMAWTSGRTFLAKSLRLFSALSLGIPP